MSRGIHTISDLRERCYVDDATGCWHWRMAMTQGTPAMWLPALGRVATLGSALSVLIDGATNRRVRWRSTCGQGTCCNPEHRKRTTPSGLMRAVGIRRSPAQIERLRRAVRRHPDELVEAIRADEGTLDQVAGRRGVSRSYVSRIRRGEIRRPAVSPFAGLLP